MIDSEPIYSELKNAPALDDMIRKVSNISGVSFLGKANHTVFGTSRARMEDGGVDFRFEKRVEAGFFEYEGEKFRILDLNPVVLVCYRPKVVTTILDEITSWWS